MAGVALSQVAARPFCDAVIIAMVSFFNSPLISDWPTSLCLGKLNFAVCKLTLNLSLSNKKTSYRSFVSLLAC